MKSLNSPSQAIGVQTKVKWWQLQKWSRAQIAGLGLVPVAAIFSFVAFGADPPAAFKTVSLSSDPLNAPTVVDKPALALSLSVEFPTVGAQYVNVPKTTTDNSYSNQKEYLGYYDAESCYNYNNAPTETPASGKTASDYKRFDRVGPAIALATPDASQPTKTSRKCTNAFSGNFLNWASNSAIDMLRLSLTGGDRTIDTPGSFDANGNVVTPPLTILQRAVLPNDPPNDPGNFPDKICMWNTSNFPGKQLGTNGGDYFGAVPTAMSDAAKNSATADKTIWIANTSNQIYFGLTKTGNTCTQANRDSYSLKAGLNTDGFFYSRVQVCNVNSTGTLQDVRDYGLCTKYPNGNYKPTGNIQKYGDQLRLAAFGYLMDQTASYNAGGRYGGVLRAPMKYVGGKTFNTDGVENTPLGGNPKKEWNENTGVFIVDPEADPDFEYSGVISYLNMFGRTGPVPGRYKKYDPIGELHYETLRYLQGLQPSGDAVNSITTKMYDGFPAYTSWTDPYAGRSKTTDYSCLKSNIIVIGDENTHDGGRLPTPDAAGNIPNINAWRTVVQNFEKDVTTGFYMDASGERRYTGNPNGANGYVPTGRGNSQIMGSAYWARTQDIRPTTWTAECAEARPGLRV